jgi:hypothetical protein
MAPPPPYSRGSLCEIERNKMDGKVSTPPSRSRPPGTLLFSGPERYSLWRSPIGNISRAQVTFLRLGSHAQVKTLTAYFGDLVRG